jgi:A/G-specific adenine glycosylase
LARAELDKVLHLWTGLGYYARGRNLHAAARNVMERHGGELPRTFDALVGLPGIGRSTAGAILSSAFGVRAPILDGNAKRVLARFHAEEDSKALWRRAEEHTPHDRVPDYTQAIMDLGATLCVRSRPSCPRCPVQERCEARSRDAIDRYPVRRQRRALPVKEVRMFVLIDPAGRYLLEQRPPTGLWGGLWGPLERPAECTIDGLLQELGTHNDCVAELKELPAFRHTFTHFHLDITPIQAVLSRNLSHIRADDRLAWYRTEDLANIGLFAPAVRLLQHTIEEPA